MKRSWNLCKECGNKEYPNTNESKMFGITVAINQTCPVCKAENKTLIPRADFEGWGD